MKLINITVPIDPNRPVHPGNTPFTIEAIKRIARGDSSSVSTLHMSAHSGTHVDAPRHFFDEGTGAEARSLDVQIGRARVIEVVSRSGIVPEDFSGIDFSKDARFLVKTRNPGLRGSPEFHADYVGVTEAAATYLVEHGVKVTGVDYLSVEQFRKAAAPAHHAFLGGGAIVIEGLNLGDVEPGTCEMFCLPLRVVGADGAPARVVARGA